MRFRFALAVLHCLIPLLSFSGEDPGPPVIIREDVSPTFKSKKDTNEERSKYSTVVIVLLVVACLVPMLQYYVRWLCNRPSCLYRAGGGPLSCNRLEGAALALSLQPTTNSEALRHLMSWKDLLYAVCRASPCYSGTSRTTKFMGRRLHGGSWQAAGSLASCPSSAAVGSLRSSRDSALPVAGWPSSWWPVIISGAQGLGHQDCAVVFPSTYGSARVYHRQFFLPSHSGRCFWALPAGDPDGHLDWWPPALPKHCAFTPTRNTPLEHQRLLGHGHDTLKGLVPPNEPARMHKHAPVDARELVQLRVPHPPPRFGQLLAAVKRLGGWRHGLDAPPPHPPILVHNVQDFSLGARRPLGGKQVRLPRRIWGEDEDLARRVRLPAAAESGGHDGAGGEPRGDHIHDRRRKLPAGKHRGGEEAAGRPAKQIRRRVDVLVPPAVEAADARRQARRRPRVTRLCLAFRAPWGATPPRGGAAGAVGPLCLAGAAEVGVAGMAPRQPS